jgi:hypothetical protein
MEQTARNEQDSVETTQESSSEGKGSEDAQSRRSAENGYGTPRQPRIDQPGETLLSMLFKFVGLGLLIIFLAMIPACGTAVICAIVYHIGNALRGGKRPSIG